eukprot:6490252-Amphidinium_carterae.3
MQKLLHMTSQPWDTEQVRCMHNVGGREFRILALHEGSLLNEFFKSTWAVFCSDTWRLAGYAETELFRSDWLVANMRPAAVCYQLVQLRVRGYPAKLFHLLKDVGADELRELAEADLRAPRCLKDSFTAAFLEQHSTTESLLDRKAREVLRLIAEEALLTTYSTERIHSSSLRAVLGRALTHRPSVSHLGLSHMAWAAPRVADVLEPVDTEIVVRQIGRPRKQLPAKTTRSGGAYKAFMSERAAGQKLTPELIRELTAKYHSLDADEKQHYQRVGVLGFFIHQ